MTDILISVDHVSKKFCRDLRHSMWYGLQDLGREMLGRTRDPAAGLRHDEFWAIDDVSFDLRRGEFLGLLGQNGAGKTTLLRMLNGLIKPDRGRIEMRGRVGAMIALGAGFSPVLSGRENVYVNASVLGLSKAEVDAKMDEIIDFAEIHEFIDAPVQTYSSGMHVRLGFAVAAVAIQPDILILDEVLAVGDTGFVVKCLNKMRQLGRDAAVVFVTHSMPFVDTFCTRVMVLERGRVLVDTSDPASGVDRYYGTVGHESRVAGTRQAQLLACALLANGETLSAEDATLSVGASVSLRLRIRVDPEIVAFGVRLFVGDSPTQSLLAFDLRDEGGRPSIFRTSEVELEVPLGDLQLAGGKYSILVAVYAADDDTVLFRQDGLLPFRVQAPGGRWCKVRRPVTPVVHGT